MISSPTPIQPPPPAPRSERLKLQLACKPCGHVAMYEIGQAVVHPELERCRAEGWDGVFLGRVIVCKGCGAIDDYQLTAQAHMRLIGETLKLVAGEQGESPFVHGVACLWDGTVVRRPSHGLDRLREATAQEPDSAAPWRRLGNFAIRYGSKKEAERAYRKAVELDEHEAEAAHSLAELYMNAGRFGDAVRYLAMTIARLTDCASPPELRRAMARSTLGNLREILDGNPNPLALTAAWTRGRAGRDPVVSVSSVDLRHISSVRWERLAEFLLDERVIRAGLTTEVPEPDEVTQLAELLSGRDHLASIATIAPYVPPPPGRNRPCPCGSGKKRKLCCER